MGSENGEFLSRLTSEPLCVPVKYASKLSTQLICIGSTCTSSITY